MYRIEGKKLLGVSITQDRYTLGFITEEGTHVYEAEGDCCNDVWFEHIDSPEVLIDATVLEVDEVYGGEISESDWEVLEHWFHKIRTEKGWCTIEMRNSHNGYYGGRADYRGVQDNEGWLENILREDI